MNKIYTALGTMSGTSMDGVDVSIIQSYKIREVKVTLFFLCNWFITYLSLIMLKSVKIKKKATLGTSTLRKSNC